MQLNDYRGLKLQLDGILKPGEQAQTQRIVGERLRFFAERCRGERVGVQRGDCARRFDLTWLF